MKLILLADIERLGKVGDEVTVRRGYARNYLLPQGYALTATRENMQFFERKRKQFEEKMEVLRGEANSLKEKIDAQELTIVVHSGENDKLYGSITTHMIADALEKDAAIVVDRRKILLDAPIRMLGTYTVRVRLHANITAAFQLHVVSDKTEDPFLEESKTEESGAVVEEGVVEEVVSEKTE